MEIHLMKNDDSILIIYLILLSWANCCYKIFPFVIIGGISLDLLRDILNLTPNATRNVTLHFM